LAYNRGSILVMTLVFVVMFLVVFTGLVGVVSRTYQQAVIQSHDALAFQVAEAGLNFGRWRLAHDEDDLSAETREVSDQFAGVLGSYDVTFSQQPGSTVVVITSIGHTASLPAREVTLRARYGAPSLARYVLLLNGDVWYGGEISGAVHANGGIRMDGESDSLMTSAQETYICQPYHGCSYEEKPGVWGSGEIKELWEFPVQSIDYAALTVDLLSMKTQAQSSNTYYASSGVFGYNVVFNNDNTYSIYRVTSRGPSVWSWFSETGWQFTSHDIGTQSLVETRAVPAGGVIYTEDRLWVSGEIQDRVTVAAGVFPDTPATNVDIILNGDISYGDVKDGTRVFGAVAQRHILIPWSGAEDVLELDGAFVAQKGRFGRRYYQNCCGTQAHAVKSRMERYGMIASNLVPVTAWVNGGGNVVSGYEEGETTYDPNLLFLPPPYFPISGQPEFISWEQVE
jgi:hypothetical protein